MGKPELDNLVRIKGSNLSQDHELNSTAYEGRTEINAQLLANLIRCTKKLEADVAKLNPPTEQ